MSETLVYSGELTVVTCWCGMRHALPSELRRFQKREQDAGRDHYVCCPLGHTHAPAGKSRADKLKRDLEWEQARARNANERAEQAERSAIAYKGVATKARKRAKAGVCPCCSRTFKQLARHMKSQHPDFDPASHQGESE